MVDSCYTVPRLAELYDLFDGDRADLEPYLALAAEIDAGSALDVGCGTGALACALSAHGLRVTGADPAAASLDLARAKPGAERISWVLGGAEAYGGPPVDLATMTGNVAQVFVTDAEWVRCLVACHAALRAGGRLAFESRDPARHAWERWTPERTRAHAPAPGGGTVETWCEVTEVSLPLVSFRWTYAFDRDGAVLTSDSTLRFRDREELVASLTAASFVVEDVRDAPDRPGDEFVFITRRA